MRRPLIAALAVLLVACGGGDDDGGTDAESAMVSYIEAALKQQGGPVYDMILPEHAALIPRDTFIGCIQDGESPNVDVEATESYTEEIDVPQLGTVETWAVTVELSTGDNSQNLTRHVIERDGEFYVFFPQDQIDAYAAGECP
jgi:hypothetical protein